MEIVRLSDITEEIVTIFNQFMFQLSPECKPLTKDYLEKITSSDHTIIFVAKENDSIAGTFSFVTKKIPSGISATIEDVVVNDSARGKGVGEMMILFAIDYARKEGINSLNLTSSVIRVAANALYQKLGFEKRETNVYRLNI